MARRPGSAASARCPGPVPPDACSGSGIVSLPRAAAPAVLSTVVEDTFTTRSARSPTAGAELRESPVDGFRALALEELVGATEGVRPKKSVMCGHGARVGRLNAREAAEQWCQVPGVAAPQDRDKRRIALGKGTDRLLGDLLPALATVTAGLAGLDGEHPVEQQDAALGPRRQVAVRRRRVAEVL